eukprot:350458-Rhodomonas_salina.2
MDAWGRDVNVRLDATRSRGHGGSILRKPCGWMKGDWKAMRDARASVGPLCFDPMCCDSDLNVTDEVCDERPCDQRAVHVRVEMRRSSGGEVVVWATLRPSDAGGIMVGSRSSSSVLGVITCVKRRR